MKRFLSMLCMCGLVASLAGCGAVGKAEQIKPEEKDVKTAHTELSEEVQQTFNDLVANASHHEYIYFDEDEYPELVVYTESEESGVEGKIYYGVDGSPVLALNPQTGNSDALILPIDDGTQFTMWYYPKQAKLIQKESHEDEGATMFLISSYDEQKNLGLSDVVIEYTKEVEDPTADPLVFRDLEESEYKYARLVFGAESVEEEEITKDIYDEAVDVTSMERLYENVE